MPTNPIHVAVAIVRNDQGQVLVALRPPQVPQGNLWEFPGGKIEPGESVEQALARELKEEVGLTLKSASPLMTLAHDYGDKQVLLDIWLVEKFDGEPQGHEGQHVQWIDVSALPTLDIPAANEPIILALLESNKL